MKSKPTFENMLKRSGASKEEISFVEEEKNGGIDLTLQLNGQKVGASSHGAGGIDYHVETSYYSLIIFLAELAIEKLK